MKSNEVGEFLRGCRARVKPEQVGLPVGGRRRVSGLRREEVATLAGLSVDYYTRLEQGRERHPSTEVLDAIARTLRLGDDARQHLYRIAGYAPRTASLERVDRVDADLLLLINRWPDNPALIIDHAYDVVASNHLGAALWRPFTYSSNLLLNVFLDDAALEFYKDWRKAAVNTTAGFRIAFGARPDDPRVKEVLADLRRSSPEFIEIWERNEARGKTADVKTFNHPDVGELTLRVQTFDVRSAPGHQLVVYHADPGTGSADRLALLGTLAATIDAAELNLPDADHLEAIPTGATRDERDRQR